MSSPVGQIVAEPASGTGAKRLNWLALPMAISLVLGGATAWSSMQQSLWIDELHTAWVSTGPWSEVTARAAAGNQTPFILPGNGGSVGHLVIPKLACGPLRCWLGWDLWRSWLS